MHTAEISETETSRRARQREASLNTEQAAAYAGVSVSYMNKLRCVGGGAAYQKIGRRVTYSPSSLDAWLDACSRTSTADAGSEAA